MADDAYNWAALIGQFAFSVDEIKFIGSTVKYGDEPGPAVGTAICDHWYGGGSISADVTFSKVSERSACQLILFYNPTTRVFVSAGLGGDALYGIQLFDGRWTAYSTQGDIKNLVSDQTYHVECRARGSFVRLLVDGVEVATAILPGSLPRTQVGLWCRDFFDISLRNFCVRAEDPLAFVVMQFTSPYNELYQEVVKPICAELRVQAVRADEAYGPGLIIDDVVRQIDEARLIIAEITPANPNVYYEVGYAHARSKPAILIADAQIGRLPFDVSPHRTLFYENTIDGKRRIEEGLRRHLKAILDPSGDSIG